MDIEQVDIEQVDIAQANISNLKNLWKKYGSTVLNNNNTLGQKSELHLNTYWPNRCWFESVPEQDISSWLTKLPATAILPVWPELEKTANKVVQASAIEQQLIANQWQCMLEQTAMSMSLKVNGLYSKEYKADSCTGFKLIKVKTAEELALWLDVVQKAFGYSVDRIVIEKLLNDSTVQILLAYYYDEAIASGILFKTGDTIGIHQVGVKPSFQGQGLARDLMGALIDICIQWQGEYLVLQASKAGQPLYQRLGFTEQFILKSYQKVIGSKVK